MSAIATIPDWWPADLNVGKKLSPPTVLRQQGNILGERTHDVVFGEVESITGESRPASPHVPQIVQIIGSLNSQVRDLIDEE
jgi:hypothetical protein